jgi:hypothetical protein
MLHFRELEHLHERILQIFHSRRGISLDNWLRNAKTELIRKKYRRHVIISLF